ncbi:protein LTO1 homolog [Paramacrobiotus metropolitanus]|uniref:protein LTO1 homolog n=1 Tax=Paramacrobiotus metropolitanus TaxID=2943436 RepID=UPI002445AEC0|nr:protein LTO1 homolog [Paramacrobiotus metropolitanus]
MDVNDVIDGILRQEESSYNEGAREGTDLGRTTGYVEGYTFGWNKGWEIGNEIGFYKGYATTVRNHLMTEKSNDSPSTKKLQAIEQLLDFLATVNFENVNSDALAEYISQSRKRFRQLFPGVFRLTQNDASTSF